MKKIIKFLNIAALAFAGAMTVGCVSRMDSPVQPQDGSTVTLTTTVGLGDQPGTRALAADGKKTFVPGDLVAIVYTDTDGGTVKALSEALTEEDITDGGKTATLTVTLSNPAPNGEVTYIYPAARANDDGTVNYGENGLGIQFGTMEYIAEHFDVAVYEGALTASAGLPAYAPLKNQLSIYQFDIRDASDNVITDRTTGFTITVRRSTYGDSSTYKIWPDGYPEEMFFGDGPVYVAMPPVNGRETLVFLANYRPDDSSPALVRYYKSVAGKDMAAGNIYPVVLRMSKAGSLAVGEGADISSGTVDTDILFGDKGIKGLADKVAAAMGVSAGELSDIDIFQYVFLNPDVVSDWPGADNSETDPESGNSLDKANAMIGGAGSDMIFGQGNDDILFGDSSLTAVTGWLELSDTPSFSQMEEKIAAMSVATLKAGLSGLETAADGGDILHGGDGDDRLFGLGGDDALRGGAGNDMLLGGNGTDMLFGGPGDDYMDGGPGVDCLDGGAGTDIIRFDALDTIDGGEGIDILLGNAGDGSLADLTNVSGVEIFLKITGSDINSLDLTSLNSFSVLHLVVSDDGTEVSLSNGELEEGIGWQLNSVVTGENGITTISFTDNDITLTLETTLQVTVNQEINEIVLASS